MVGDCNYLITFSRSLHIKFEVNLSNGIGTDTGLQEDWQTQLPQRHFCYFVEYV
jgi:hypothetical protein